MNRRFLFLVFLLLSVTSGYGQHYNYDLLSMKDGLPSNFVYSVMTDQKGFVWITTDRGVARYDGHSVKVFTTAEGLATNDIWRTWEDSQGRIWLFSFGEVFQYIKDGHVITAWKKPSVSIGNLYESEGIIYTMDKYGIYTYNNDSLTQIVHSRFSNSDFVLSSNYYLHLDMKDSLYAVVSFTSKEEIRTYSAKSFCSIKNSWYLQDSTFLFYRDVSGQMITRWNWLNNEKIVFDLTEEWGKHLADVLLFKYKDGIQVTSSRGCLIFNQNLEVVDRFLEEEGGNDILGKLVSIDENGVKYKALKGEGLYLLPKQKANARHFDLNGIKQIAYLSENISGHLTVIGKNGQIAERIENKFRATRLASEANKSVRAVLDINGKIETYNFIEELVPNMDEKQRATGALKGVFYNAKLNWIAAVGGNGSMVFERKKGKNIFLNFHLGRQYTTVISADSIVWYGGANGLSYFYRDTVISLGARNKLFQKSINKIILDSHQNVWVGTDGYGVYAYKEGRAIEVKGCKYDIVSDLVLDPSGDIWASTNHGIKRISVTDKASFKPHVTRIYTSVDGLSDYSISRIYVTDSMLYAGSSKGIDMIPLVEERQSILPKLYINSVLVNGQSDLDLLKIDYKDNNIEVQCAGVSLASKEALVFVYFIEGYTEDTLSTHDEHIKISQIPSGNYKMLIYAKDVIGNRSKTQEINFVIGKPWYASWWAILLFISIVSAVIYARTRYLINRERSKQKVSKRIAELELQALQSQMNPHFIFNALGAIQQYQYGDKAADAEEYFSGFARLMRLYLESSKNASIPLVDELELIRLYVSLEKLRFKDKFEVDFYIDKDVEEVVEHVSIPSMVLQPFVENSINHGLFHKKEPGTLVINILKINEDWIEVRIKDNGIGREAANLISKSSQKNHKSRAMQIIEERLRIMNTDQDTAIKIDILDLYDDEGSPIGTEVHVRLPILD